MQPITVDSITSAVAAPTEAVAWDVVGCPETVKDAGEEQEEIAGHTLLVNLAAKIRHPPSAT